MPTTLPAMIIITYIIETAVESFVITEGASDVKPTPDSHEYYTQFYNH
jgi:hypothetical protein